ncbi:unnamed protein product [Alternaria alternata]
MPSTFEPSAHDKLAQAQYEEMLKARVLRDFIIASLIVPRVNCDHKPNQFPALQVLLQSEVTSDIVRAHESLVDALRVKMTTPLRHAERLVNEL